MDRSLTTKILIIILTAFLMITVISQAVVIPQNAYRTEVARLYQITDTIKFDGVFLRDEHIVSSQVNGVIEYEHDDGAKVAKNSVIASVYTSGADVELCRRIENLRSRLETLIDAQNLAGTDNSQVEAFNNLITEKHSELMKAIAGDDYDAVSRLKYQMLNLQSKRDIAKGRTAGYESVINDLEQQIDVLESRISAQPQELISGETGYFVSSIDGYEEELSYDAAADITSAQIDEIIANPVKSGTDSNAIGKMIEDYTWKLVAVLDEHSSALITAGESVELYYAADGSTLKVFAESLNKQDDGSTVAVFSGDLLSSSLASSRTGRFELVVDGYNGIRVSASAIRFNEKGEKGVYVLFGNLGYFKRIEDLYSSEDYVIVEHKPDVEGYLALYDNVIVSGKFDIFVGSENSDTASSEEAS